MAGLRRGDIHRVRFGRSGGRAQAGERPAVILQTNAMAALSTVIVAPLSASAADAPFRPTITVDGTASRMLAEQLRSVDVTRVGKRLGHLSADESVDVNTAVRLVLGLP